MKHLSERALQTMQQIEKNLENSWNYPQTYRCHLCKDTGFRIRTDEKDIAWGRRCTPCEERDRSTYIPPTRKRDRGAEIP